MPTYIFDHFEVDGIPYTTNPLQVTLSANTTVTAVYVLKTIQLTLNSTPINVAIDVDGTTQGTTPIVLAVPTGTHTISVPDEVAV